MMAKSPVEGFDDSRQTVDPYRTESPTSTDASAGRVRKVAKGGFRSDKSSAYLRPKES